MNKLLSTTALAVLISATAGFAATMPFDVHANSHVWNNGSGFGSNLGLATGLSFGLGDTFSVSVDNPLDTWNFCSPSTSCTVDADGRRPASGTFLGTYSNGGYSNYYGALVGRIGAGAFFAIGTAGFSGPANAVGELVLFHWDHNTNNSGSLAVTVEYETVPLPASLPLMLLGLGAVGYAGRRRS